MVILAVVIPALVLGALVVVFAASRRRDTDQAIGRLSRETRSRDRSDAAPALADEAPTPTGREVERAAVLSRLETGAELVKAEAATPVAYVPPDPEQIGVNRRQFLNRSMIGFMGLGLSGFGAAIVAFLWPGRITGFGGRLTIGPVSDLLTEIEDANGFLYFAEGRMWLTHYPAGALEKARAVYSPPELEGMEAGVVALFQKCPHLGCRVPQCDSSQWFECPCHGSRYNQVGEKRGGPAPRGMDHFAMAVSDGVLIVDTGAIIQGPPIGTNTTGQEPEGPSCLGQTSE